MARNTSDILSDIAALTGDTDQATEQSRPTVEWSTPKGAGLVTVPHTFRPVAVTKSVVGTSENGNDIVRWTIAGLEMTGHELDGQEFKTASAARKAVEDNIVSIMALWPDETDQDQGDATETSPTVPTPATDTPATGDNATDQGDTDQATDAGDNAETDQDQAPTHGDQGDAETDAAARIRELESQLAALRGTGHITPDTDQPGTDVTVYDAGPFATNPAPNLPARNPVSAAIIADQMNTPDAAAGEAGYRQYLSTREQIAAQREADKAMATELRDSIAEYLILPAAYRDAYLGVMTLWTMHTYTYRAQGTTPYLAVSAPTRGAGKTTVLNVLRTFAHNPTKVEINPTEPVVRVHASHGRSLFLDEIDELARKGGSFIQILNSGYKEGGAVSRTIRIKGVGTDTEEAPTFAPKAFAAIAREGYPLPAATQERCIFIRVERATSEEASGIRRFRVVDAERDARSLRASLDDWSLRVDRQIRDARPDMPEMSTARAAEIWEPLFAIADVIGWGAEVREWAAAIDGQIDESEADPNALFLADVRDVMTKFVERYPTEKYMPAKEVPALRNAYPERRLSEQLTPVATGKRLASFGIRSTPVRGERVYKIGTGTGELLPELIATFDRYTD